MLARRLEGPDLRPHEVADSGEEGLAGLGRGATRQVELLEADVYGRAGGVLLVARDLDQRAGGVLLVARDLDQRPHRVEAADPVTHLAKVEAHVADSARDIHDRRARA